MSNTSLQRVLRAASASVDVSLLRDRVDIAAAGKIDGEMPVSHTGRGGTESQVHCIGRDHAVNGPGHRLHLKGAPDSQNGALGYAERCGESTAAPASSIWRLLVQRLCEHCFHHGIAD